jgi:glycosyltransferase involved in cell wall biosynthesis
MSKIAFCFIVKDGEKYLEKNLIKIIDLGNDISSEYRIYYAENDSTDNTINILQQFKKKYNNINGIHLNIDGLHSTFLCKNYNNYNCSNRTRRLAFLRNSVLNQAKQWHTCDYIIMIDLDFIDFDKKQFNKMFNIINNNSNIDGIFGMSVNENNYLYDYSSIKPIYKIFYILNKYKLIKVESAFSGFGIYKMKSIGKIQYNLNTNRIEHIDFNKKLNNLYVYSLFNPIYESNNSDYYFFTYQIKIILILIFGIWYLVFV